MKPSKLAIYKWILPPLVLVALVAGVITSWAIVSQHARSAMQQISDDTQSALVAHVHDRARVLLQTNASAYNLAKILGSSGSVGNQSLLFSTIESQVSPRLFLAFTTVPWVSQISYIGLNGLFFSYYHEGNQTRAMFSNSSVSMGDSPTWYNQPVNVDTGDRYGEAIGSAPPDFTCYEWLHNPLNGKSGHTCLGLGLGLGYAQETLFFFTAPMGGNGAVSIGVVVKEFTNFVSGVDLHGGYLYLVREDGHVLAQTGPPHTSYVLLNNIVTVHVIDPKNDTSILTDFLNLSCGFAGSAANKLGDSQLNVLGRSYSFYCSSIDAPGFRLVSVLAFPGAGFLHFLGGMNIIVILLMSVLILAVIVVSGILSQLFKSSQRNERLLQANLIKQKELTQETEMKSMNKSLAFASASHDVRTSLAGITGLIEICRSEVSQQPEMDKNLLQMSVCASKLLGILNSVLDISKVEAGKIQLEEVEFDMAQVLEESIDIFHVVALKKGLEVIWDPCDFSILRSQNVKGDCRRLKQILDNLLGNAIKFTSEGHVVVRAWAKKPSWETFKLSVNHGCNFPNIFGPLSCWFSKDDDLGSLGSVQRDPSSIEFVFEVDDTGMGIPKEKRTSVFENYVQVKESGIAGHEGTGLGLGIVQSYVRLMGGEISIQDKEPGEKGTCFRFNIFIKSSVTSSTGAEGEDANSSSDRVQKEEHQQNTSISNVQHQGGHVTIQSNIRAMAFSKGLKMDGIQTILLVEGEETRKILKKWMESLGIKVWIVYHRERLYVTLEKIKLKFLNNLSSPGKSDSVRISISPNKTTSLSSNGGGIVDVSASSKDSCGHALPLTIMDIFKKSSSRGSTYVLVLIDLSYGNLTEMITKLKHFKSTPHIQCKVVWLVNSNTPTADLRSLKQATSDLILEKPFHGSRLYALLRLLEEFGGTDEAHPCEMRVDNTFQEEPHSTAPDSSMEQNQLLPISAALQSSDPTPKRSALKPSVIDGKPLSDMKILLVEDNNVLRHTTSILLSRLGATVEISKNGREALNLIRTALREATDSEDGSTRTHGVSRYFRYNVVLMDCEMPIMDGYEATRHIRTEEKHYGYHIPIIALTAHEMAEEEQKTILSGMDFHLTKPVVTGKLLHAIHSVSSSYIQQ